MTSRWTAAVPAGEGLDTERLREYAVSGPCADRRAEEVAQYLLRLEVA